MRGDVTDPRYHNTILMYQLDGDGGFFWNGFVQVSRRGAFRTGWVPVTTGIR